MSTYNSHPIPSFVYKLTWIALKVTLLYNRQHNSVHNVRLQTHSKMIPRDYKRIQRKVKHLVFFFLFVFVSCQQYALYKKMTQAAILIQSKFRSYHEQKKFQQSRRAAVLIQQYYRSYKEFGRQKPHHRGAAAALVQHKLR